MSERLELGLQSRDRRIRFEVGRAVAYERTACRAGGGRVYAASGQEITLATEAEYDKRVRRVRFQVK